MPTYDYECESCGHGFELFQQITERPVKTCPECGKRKAQRLIGTGAAVIFKGSGFYQTDYRSKDYKTKVAAENKKDDHGTKKPGAKGAKTGVKHAAQKKQ